MTKRIFDICGALAFFVLFGWLFIIIWLLVVRHDGFPGIYSHKRVGRDGKMFGCLKFRSMVKNSDVVLAELLKNDASARMEWETTFKLKNDPRITPIGRFLRKSSLDELPQFWNVILGEMSLVGPRPVVQAELENYYGKHADEYKLVRPGITGPWQVSGRSDLTYSQRVALDVEYIKSMSLLGDIKLIFQTMVAVFGARGSY